MGRFLLEKSKVDQGWHVLTDLENLVVIKFKDGDYLNTKNITCLGDKIEDERMKEILSDAANYMALHKAVEGLSGDCGVIFPEDFEFSNYSYEKNKLIFYCKTPIKIKVVISVKDFTYNDLIKSLENLTTYLKKEKGIWKI